jgi:hypothetical protein
MGRERVFRKSWAALHHKRGAQTLRFLSVMFAAVALGICASPASAVTTKTVSFSGHYSGTASLVIDNNSVTIASITGRGTGTPSIIGASTVSGHGTASASAQCDPFGGTGAIVGAKSKITFSVASSTATGCSSGESGPVTVTFHGTARATGGTGSAKGASGSLRFSGSLKLANTSGTQSGTFTVTMSGKLSIK